MEGIIEGGEAKIEGGEGVIEGGKVEIKCGLLPLYAFRLKGVRGDSWRIMRVEVEGLTGKLRHLARSIPPLPLTGRGTPHLDWNSGMPVHRFLSLVCKSNGAGGIVSDTGFSNTTESALG